MKGDWVVCRSCDARQYLNEASWLAYLSHEPIKCNACPMSFRMPQVLDDPCIRCGKIIEVGDWPSCTGDPSDHVMEHAFGYNPMEPYVDADILDRKDPRVEKGGYRNAEGRAGILIETRSDRKRLMKERGLQFGGNHPGGREV